MGIYGCHGLTTQRWRLMNDGIITNGISCLRWDAIGIQSCNQASLWSVLDGTLRPKGYDSTCLTKEEGTTEARLRKCSEDMKVCDIFKLFESHCKYRPEPFMEVLYDAE